MELTRSILSTKQVAVTTDSATEVGATVRLRLCAARHEEAPQVVVKPRSCISQVNPSTTHNIEGQCFSVLESSVLMTNDVSVRTFVGHLTRLAVLN